MDNTCDFFNYLYENYEVDHYITILIPGVKKYVKKLICSSNVKGKCYYYASAIR